MKTQIKILAAFAISLAAVAPATFAQLAIPSDGSDGVLNITSNTVIDLSQSVTGTWSDNNSAHAGKGIYDPVKWAVVFKYSSVTIASNCTVTFLNNSTHAPVVWLVTNSVTINGTISLTGQPSSPDPVNLPEPGPGGFRGGAEAQGNEGQGSGFGPGGGYNDSAGYADYRSYGNLQIVPLIGGSGGSGANWNGNGGGGAILIAAAGTITVNGYCGSNNASDNNAYYGSGGAIRLVANQILGSGEVQAVGAHPGRIRIEANTTSPSLITDPITTGVSPIPLVIWPAANAPTATILSIAGQTAPSDPKAAMPVSNGGDDLTIATNSPITILVQTANFPTNGTVNVVFRPRNGPPSGYNASLVSGTPALATWQITQAPPGGHFVVQVRATSP